MRLLSLVIASALLALAACGDARRERALEAIESSRIVVTDVETSGSEAPPVRAALADASARLEETEHAYDMWGGATGSRAFERSAACFAAALGELREALLAAGEAVPVDLETSEATMASFTERPCRRE